MTAVVNRTKRFEREYLNRQHPASNRSADMELAGSDGKLWIEVDKHERHRLFKAQQPAERPVDSSATPPSEEEYQRMKDAGELSQFYPRTEDQERALHEFALILYLEEADVYVRRLAV